MPKFVPQSYQLAGKLIDWATEKFGVTKDEVERQFELMQDHEFRRNYTDWDRVFRNWMRKADEIGTLKRERKYTNTVVELTPAEREAEARKAEENLRRLQAISLKVVK